jgi:PEP-CTERM motif
MKLVSILAAAAAIAFAAPAGAATINYSGQVTLDPSQIDASGNFLASLPGDAVAFNPGDEIFGTITFANNGRLIISDKPDAFGDEYVYGTFTGDQLVGGSFRLLGIQGDYVGPAEQTFSCGGLCINTFSDLTPTSFSFTGVEFYMLHRGDAVTSFDPNTLFVGNARTAIEGVSSPVPEPATWAMMIFGFGAVGRALRRRGGTRALSAV